MARYAPIAARPTQRRIMAHQMPRVAPSIHHCNGKGHQVCLAGTCHTAAMKHIELPRMMGWNSYTTWELLELEGQHGGLYLGF